MTTLPDLAVGQGGQVTYPFPFPSPGLFGMMRFIGGVPFLRCTVSIVLWREARRQPAIAMWLIARSAALGALLFLVLHGPAARHLLHGPAAPPAAPAIVVSPAPTSK